MGTILSGVFGLAKGLFGGASNSGLASEVIEKVLPETLKEQQAAAIASEDEDIKDVTSAREYNAPDIGITQYQIGMGLIPWFMVWILDVLGRITDTVNHMLRPAMMIWIIGGFMKKWPLPDPKTVDPQLWTVFMVMVTFWFGARTLVKDVPAMIAALKK